MRGRILLAVLLGLALALPAAAEEKRVDIDISGRPYLGPEKAPVTIVEFLDFQ